MKIKDRIKELRRVKGSELIPNPKNWRRHPKGQHDAMRGVLAEIGFAGAAIARETPDGLILLDGHLRAEVSPDQEIPVLVLDVNEAEADMILATFDPLGAMAETDKEVLENLLANIDVESEATQAMLDDMATEAGITIEEPVEIIEDEAPTDRAMELQEQWGTEPGQLWKIASSQWFKCPKCDKLHRRKSA